MKNIFEFVGYILQKLLARKERHFTHFLKLKLKAVGYILRHFIKIETRRKPIFYFFI